jgi:hypothetical protein
MRRQLTSLRPAGAGHLHRDGVDPAEWLAQHRLTPVLRRHADVQRPPVRTAQDAGDGYLAREGDAVGQRTTGEKPDDTGPDGIGDPDRARRVQADTAA